ALSGAAQNGPSVPNLPATFSLNFPSAGKYEVVATVRASGYTDGTGTVVVTPRLPGTAGGAAGPIFFDGAEGDASQWTITSVLMVQDGITMIVQPACDPTNTACAPYPGPCKIGGTDQCKWFIDSSAAKTDAKSWHSGYPDLYRSTMTSKDIPIPAGALSHQLSFYIKGGAEQGNGIDGLTISAGPSGALVALPLINDIYDEFTLYTLNIDASVNGKNFQVAFQFDSDSGCSDNSGVPPNLPIVCAAGSDKGGYWLDDITVL
ncbi:MAG: hypothetical protein LC620_06150, partial [Halobacteriales archaeon]|nr:hypothetical protein [Halobacteriales archaeon]